VLGEVGVNIPEKRQLILYTGLSKMQKLFYKAILAKDFGKLFQTTKSTKTSLMNVVMQLRKACNHPYLFDGAEEEINGEFQLGEHLIKNSGKLVVLDKLLKKLHKEGHKVCNKHNRYSKIMHHIVFLTFFLAPRCCYSLR